MLLPINYKHSPVWKKAMDLAISINHSIRTFPEQERHFQGLCDQLLQSAIRVTSRIAESHEPLSDSPVDLLLRARFNLSETEFLLDLSLYLGYIEPEERARMQEISEDIRSLINQLLQRTVNRDKKAFLID
jgi:four helix bundle protein